MKSMITVCFTDILTKTVWILVLIHYIIRNSDGIDLDNDNARMCIGQRTHEAG